MNAARVLLICVALAAGGAAAFLARSAEEKKSEAPVIQFVTTDAPIAKRILGVATALSNQDLPWQARLSAMTGGSGISDNT